MHEDNKKVLAELIRAAEAMSSDLGDTVTELLREGLDNPLSADEIGDLLEKVVEVVRRGAIARGDNRTVNRLNRRGKALIQRAQEARRLVLASASDKAQGVSSSGLQDRSVQPIPERTILHLQPFDGIEPRPVRPTPVFHERSVAVVEGFVQVQDIELWDENERLEIHLNQFQQNFGRGPDAEELMSIMKGKMPLQGIDASDQFKIRNLAKSIAVNGVRKPPIIDIDGTLLDGNRRVAACHEILEDAAGDFNPEEKQRAEWLKVWQLTEHATDQDRDAVIVSLNFEPDYKEDWPEYVKAQKVHAMWETLLSLEPRANPGTARVREIRREIARKFALAVNEVTRYINMVGLAREFEDFQVVDRSKDKFEAKHRASDRFQYFDELTKGKNPGGVLWSLNQEPSFKHLVFDLLYDGKFRNWRKVRDLKYVYENEDAIAELKKARAESDVEAAWEDVENAISVARMARAERRQQGANTKIRAFTEWFLGLPVKAFDPNEPGSVTPENMRRLHGVLRHVESYLSESEGEARI